MSAKSRRGGAGQVAHRKPASGTHPANTTPQSGGGQQAGGSKAGSPKGAAPQPSAAPSAASPAPKPVEGQAAAPVAKVPVVPAKAAAKTQAPAKPAKVAAAPVRTKPIRAPRETSRSSTERSTGDKSEPRRFKFIRRNHVLSLIWDYVGAFMPLIIGVLIVATAIWAYNAFTPKPLTAEQQQARYKPIEATAIGKWDAAMTVINSPTSTFEQQKAGMKSLYDATSAFVDSLSNAGDWGSSKAYMDELVTQGKNVMKTINFGVIATSQSGETALIQQVDGEFSAFRQSVDTVHTALGLPAPTPGPSTSASPSASPSAGGSPSESPSSSPSASPSPTPTPAPSAS